MTPKKRDSRKDPLILDQKTLKLPFINFLSENLSILFMRSWYIPVINAIVPPEIPGIISTEPIKTPIKYVKRLFFFDLRLSNKIKLELPNEDKTPIVLVKVS